jgi:EAL domain-containing protein (putative c-di-GMP-specific phosphodiesterase class I)
MRTGQLVGMEALVRWQHPSLGLVAPSKFIPVAEDTGMIVAIGEWVMLEACREAQRWRELGLADVPVAVNLSANQFRAGVRDCVARALAYSGLPANRLELEVTESLVMGAADQVIASLRELKEMGLILSIDDFGTGYSSLSYLKRFPIDRLKIDRSFVCDITTNPDDAAITTAIIHLGHNLRLHVVAEGVETRQQWDFLREQGCDQAQGYWISKPLDSEALLEFLRSWQGGLSS